MKASKSKSAPPVPRALEEINQDYRDVCQKAGELKYKMFIDEERLKQLHSILLNLNNEGAARNQLDTQEAAKKASEEVKKDA